LCGRLAWACSAARNVELGVQVSFMLKVVYNFKINTEDEEESDEDEIVEPAEIIKVDEDYETNNRLLGLK
jgi:hypothetical protein